MPPTAENGDPVDAAALTATVRVARVFAAVTAESIARAGTTVTLPQLRVLFLVAESEVVSNTAVAAAMGIHISNASRICDRLVQAELLARRDDPADRRRTALTVTPAGAELLASVTDHRRTAFAEILSEVPVTHLAQVTAALTAFAEAGERRRPGDSTLMP